MRKKERHEKDGQVHYEFFAIHFFKICGGGRGDSILTIPLFYIIPLLITYGQADAEI